MTAETTADVTPIQAVRDDADYLTFEGKKFLVAPKMGAMAYMRFAHIADQGVEVEDLETLAAIYDVLEQAIDPADWGSFQAHARSTRADIEDLIKLVQQAVAVMSARPTRRPTDSSSGPSGTAPSSSVVSSSVVSSDLSPREAQRREHLSLLRPVDELVEAIALASGTG